MDYIGLNIPEYNTFDFIRCWPLSEHLPGRNFRRERLSRPRTKQDYALPAHKAMLTGYSKMGKRCCGKVQFYSDTRENN
jgi:hypothetical protein